MSFYEDVLYFFSPSVSVPIFYVPFPLSFSPTKYNYRTAICQKSLDHKLEENMFLFLVFPFFMYPRFRFLTNQGKQNIIAIGYQRWDRLPD
jgi:hypothetical protein